MIITTQVHLLLFQFATAIYLMSLVCFLLRQHRLAGHTLLLGFVVQSVSQIVRCWRFGFFTLEGAFQIDYFLPWSLAIMLLVHLYRQQKSQQSGILSALWPLCISSLLACFFPPSCHAPTPFTPTWTAYLFFIFEALAHACFILSGWRALEYLTKRQQKPFFNGYAVWGFVFYSLAQLTGCAWAYLGWGGLFHWGTRHIHSAALWCFYCSYLHTPFVQGFNQRRRAGFALGGAVLALVLFFALPLIPKDYGQTKKLKIEQMNPQSATAQLPDRQNKKEVL